MSTTIQPTSAVFRTAVKIDLVYGDDETQKLRINAIVADGKIVSQEMHCHLIEWNSERGQNELQPVILTAQDDSYLIYEVEWGYGHKSDVRFIFLDRALSVGQEVARVDVLSGVCHDSIYRIVSITDLLK